MRAPWLLGPISAEEKKVGFCPTAAELGLAVVLEYESAFFVDYFVVSVDFSGSHVFKQVPVDG